MINAMYQSYSVCVGVVTYAPYKCQGMWCDVHTYSTTHLTGVCVEVSVLGTVHWFGNGIWRLGVIDHILQGVSTVPVLQGSNAQVYGDPDARMMMMLHYICQSLPCTVYIGQWLCAYHYIYIILRIHAWPPTNWLACSDKISKNNAMFRTKTFLYVHVL